MAGEEHKIELWSWSTPNGWKVEIALNEIGVPYKYIPIDISKGEQFTPEFLKVSPNGKIPGIVDKDVKGEPIHVFESGAILIYLAQKYGKLLPDAKTDPKGNADVLQWLMWQMAGFGPMLGQYNHFTNYAPEKIQYAIDRYTREANRLYKVLDTQLATHPFVAGKEFSIADIAIWGWAAIHERQKFNLKQDYPHVFRWFEEVRDRPSVTPLWQKLVERAEKEKAEGGPKGHSAEAMKILFGVDVNKDKK